MWLNPSQALEKLKNDETLVSKQGGLIYGKLDEYYYYGDEITIDELIVFIKNNKVTTTQHIRDFIIKHGNILCGIRNNHTKLVEIHKVIDIDEWGESGEYWLHYYCANDIEYDDMELLTMNGEFIFLD